MSTFFGVPTSAQISRLLARLGWDQVAEGTMGSTWAKGRESVALPRNLGTDVQLSQDLVERIARVERASPLSLWIGLFHGPSDVISAGLIGRTLNSGLLPLGAATDVVTSARKMLASAGTSVIRPARSINGQYRPEAQRVAKEALLAHTKPGSFIFPLYVPLDVAIEPGQTEAHEEIYVESYPRQVTRRLAESLSMASYLMQAPEADLIAESTLSDAASIGVTRELCKSLDVMMRNDAVIELALTFEWAVTPASVPESLPKQITFDREVRPKLRKLADRLALPGPDRKVEFSGTVTDVHQPPDADDDDYHFTISTYYENRRQTLKVEIGAETAASAAEWFAKRSTVVVRGDVRETPAGLVMRRPETVRIFVEDHLSLG